METKQKIINYLKSTHGSFSIGHLCNLIQTVAEESLSDASFNRFLDKCYAEDQLTENLDCWIINGVIYDHRVFEFKKWEMLSDFLERLTYDDLVIVEKNLKAKVRIEILQLKDSSEFKYQFAPYKYAVDHGFSENDYVSVWQGACENVLQKDCITLLDEIFRCFNCVTDEDVKRFQKLKFKGHSLSTSDIVVVDGKKFYCDRCGWQEL